MMPRKYFSYCLRIFASALIAVFAAFCCTAKDDKSTTGIWQQDDQLHIVENKGQITDQEGNVRHDIQFRISGKGVTMFIGTGAIHYQFASSPSSAERRPLPASALSVPAPAKIQTSRIDVTLVGANKDAKVITGNKQAYYEQYFLPRFKGTCRAFSSITYKNIYPNIDWVIYLNDNKPEYDFIVHPGGNARDIRLQYNGADIATDGRAVRACTIGGSVYESSLRCYEQKTGTEVASAFSLQDNAVTFQTEQIAGTLVIDPTIAWSTYLGGTSLDYATGVVVDNNARSVYITGYAGSRTNIATAGSYQDSLVGAVDAFVARFSDTGTIDWATYYGGNLTTYANAISLDDTGNIYITGVTLSTDSIATAGAYQASRAGSEDAFLAKFSGSGLLQWATYFGGPANDWGTTLKCDHSGNVYLGGSTGSTSMIASPGAYQPAFGGGSYDGFLAKFSCAGAFGWATYFGGDTIDAIMSVIASDAGVYVTGYTQSTSHIATAGAFKTSGGGMQSDAFLAKFTTAGGIMWATYFGGSSGDIATGITDATGGVTIAGMTFSPDSIATSGAHQAILLGGQDAFIANFNDTGNLLWATYYGGTGTGGTDINAIAHDGAGNIYVTGLTGAFDSIATPDGYRTHFMGGGDDAFVAEFSGAGTQLWGSYFGGHANEAGYSVTVDAGNNFYVAGRTLSPDSIATPGAYQTVYGGDPGDVFLAKFQPPGTLQAGLQAADILCKVYPNPACELLYVHCNTSGNAALKLTDIFGAEVARIGHLQQGVNSIDISRLSPGEYFYSIEQDGQLIKRGMIVKQ